MLMRFDPLSEFDRLSRSLWNESANRAPVPIDAVQRGHDFVVTMDLPGIDLDTLDVTVERNALTVSASRMTALQDGDRPLIGERPVGRFTRQLFLSDDVDADHIVADYEDGVLTLVVPMAETARPKRVTVRRRSTAAELPS